jgi:hypothetical protein
MRCRDTMGQLLGALILMVCVHDLVNNYGCWRDSQSCDWIGHAAGFTPALVRRSRWPFC